MAQIDSYLRRVMSECTLSSLEDIYDLYSFVPNEDLRSLMAIYHTQLNNWFAVLNSDLRVEYDDIGEKVYKGGYFHAQDSRGCMRVSFLRVTAGKNPDSIAAHQYTTRK